MRLLNKDNKSIKSSRHGRWSCYFPFWWMLFRILAISHRLKLLLLSSDGVLYILLKYQCHGNWSKHYFRHIIKTWYKSMQIKITKIPNFFTPNRWFPPTNEPSNIWTFESLDDWSEIYDGGYGSSYVFNIVWNVLCLCLSGLWLSARYCDAI